MNFKKKLILLFLLLTVAFQTVSVAEVVYNENSVDIQAVEATQDSKYADYARMYVGEDKYEKFNRKMFNLNSKLNKFVARPVHIIWSSIMPKYGMDRIRDVYNNIEYPKRLVSCLLQKDGKGIKTETARFLTNTTIGLGGLFDPADKIFKIKPTNENMEQALCRCKMNSGSYLVMPCINSCTPRSLCGRALEAALDPAVYLASPLTSIIKFGLMVNRTSYMQPLAKMIETNYADPYDIHKKLFGLENYIRNSNYDRNVQLSEKSENAENFDDIEGFLTGASADVTEQKEVEPDILLEDYKIQSPVVDSMKTALFEDKSINKSMWNELSIWNHSFAKRVKTASVEVTEGRDKYQFKYILQKDKSAPLVIIYPSIGEGAGAHHSIVFAKMFYDEGCSVVMPGSHFHWEFVKSMPEGYTPGLPYKDVDNIRLVTSKILGFLENKYECKFNDKTIVGTSFGALATLFVADKEKNDNMLGINKFIAICPPIKLNYALEQLDKNAEVFNQNSQEVKDKTAITAAKLLNVLDVKNSLKDKAIDTLPFSDEEGKLITSFILRQKLSDLIYTIEQVSPKDKTDIYESINNMSYRDYAEKYLLSDETFDEIEYKASLYSLKDYLENSDNYRIYHSLDDYFINKPQLAKLKDISKNKITCFNCGSHLGFLYRKEFADAIIKEIKKEI